MPSGITYMTLRYYFVQAAIHCTDCEGSEAGIMYMRMASQPIMVCLYVDFLGKPSERIVILTSRTGSLIFEFQTFRYCRMSKMLLHMQRWHCVHDSMVSSMCIGMR